MRKIWSFIFVPTWGFFTVSSIHILLLKNPWTIQYLGTTFGYSNIIRKSQIDQIPIVLFGLNYLNSNTEYFKFFGPTLVTILHLLVLGRFYSILSFLYKLLGPSGLFPQHPCQHNFNSASFAAAAYDRASQRITLCPASDDLWVEFSEFAHFQNSSSLNLTLGPRQTKLCSFSITHPATFASDSSSARQFLS